MITVALLNEQGEEIGERQLIRMYVDDSLKIRNKHRISWENVRGGWRSHRNVQVELAAPGFTKRTPLTLGDMRIRAGDTVVIPAGMFEIFLRP